jgi:hypothetical protein
MTWASEIITLKNGANVTELRERFSRWPILE